MKSIFIIFVIALLSCSSPVEWRPSLQNTVSFSEEFSPEEKVVILRGFNVWGRETLCNASFIEMIDGRIAIKKATDQEMIDFDASSKKETAGVSAENRNPQIFFMFQRINTPLMLELVAAHEAGHNLGMEHIPEEEAAIMNPSINKLIIADHLTKYDLNQFNNYWRCQ